MTVKVKGQIMYFLVNASPPKALDLATSKGHMMQRILRNISCGQRYERAGICDVVPSTTV